MALGTINRKSLLPCTCWLRVRRLPDVPGPIPQGSQNIRGNQEHGESDDNSHQINRDNDSEDRESVSGVLEGRAGAEPR